MGVRDTIKRGLSGWTTSMLGPEVSRAIAGADRGNEFGVDPFGFSVDYSLSAIGPFVWLYKHYFRVETSGIEKVPDGRVLLVANHSGQLPLDGAMIGMSMLLDRVPPRPVRSMVEKWVATLPFVSTFYARIGQIVGTPENCRRLLARDEAILVFPEGMKAITKLYHQRYQLQPFGLGFMRLALETDTPVVPVAVIGAEEQAPAVVNVKPVARALGLPAFPLTPYGPPLPLPTKYRLYFGEPLRFTGRADDEDQELRRKVAVVQAAVEQLVQRGLAERKAVFW